MLKQTHDLKETFRQNREQPLNVMMNFIVEIQNMKKLPEQTCNIAIYTTDSTNIDKLFIEPKQLRNYVQ